MEKEYPIKKKRDEFFRAYVEMIRPFLDINNREADVFAELIRQNYKRINIQDKQDRFRLILSNEGRGEIELRLGISRAVLRNIICKLKAHPKKLIKKEDNTIHNAYLIEPNGKKASIKFIFELEND